MGVKKRTLVLGYGNPARGDDGLGPALVERLAALALDDLETRVDYQLCVEDAMDIGGFEQVVFVDASLNAVPPFLHYRIPEVVTPTILDTHSISPEALIHLARTLFGAKSQASVLEIRGYHFEPFTESLSVAAAQNLNAAFLYLKSVLEGHAEVSAKSVNAVHNCDA